ncbi:hypothetical protein HPB47_004611 [Ixodes persulcatus]|uniref:Uncharacterized protein n=1 Tax=Ixodes persulcatus TaxID=34615 RepID=A0AC60PFG3_IXOPE|nr:hypothetical protein HPB47_004611 [Ixodes persulcatus]
MRWTPVPSGNGSSSDHSLVQNPGYVPGRLVPDYGRVKAVQGHTAIMASGAPIAGPTRDSTKGRKDKRRQARRTALIVAIWCAASAAAAMATSGVTAPNCGATVLYSLGKRVRPTALTPERLPAAVNMDNSAKLPSFAGSPRRSLIDIVRDAQDSTSHGCSRLSSTNDKRDD